MRPEDRRPNLRLRREREQHNWTLNDAVRELRTLMASRGETQAGVDVNTLSRWERGTIRPNTRYRHYLCLLYDKQPDQLGFLPIECAELEEFTPSAPGVASRDPQASPSVNDGHATQPRCTEGELEALNITRRKLLAASGVLGAALGTETAAQVAEPLDRAARVADGRATADSHLVADLQAIIDRFETTRSWVSGDLLIEPLRAHLDLIKSVLGRSLLPEQRETLLRTASQTALLLSATEHFNRGDRAAARFWLTDGLQLGESTSDPNTHVLGLLRAAQQATYSGRATTSVQLLEQARRLAERGCGPNVLSWVLVDLAEAHAVLQQPKEVPRLLGLAADAQQRTRPDDTLTWIEPWGRANIAGYIGAVNMRLEQPGKARAGLHEALAAVDPSDLKPRSIYLVDLATTYAQDLDIEQACDLAGKALELAGPIRLNITLERVASLRHRLGHWPSVRAVRELDDRLQTLNSA